MDNCITPKHKLLISIVRKHNVLCKTDGETSSDKVKVKEEWMKIGRQLNISDAQCEIQWSKINKMLKDSVAQKSENDGTAPAKRPKLEIEEELAFVLPYMSNTCCPSAAVPLEDETSSCSNPNITESVFEFQRRIHSEKDAQESVLFSPEIMENIFRMLDLAEQNSFRLVCKQWNKMAHEYWSGSSLNCREKIEQLKRMCEDDLDGCFESLLSLIKERPLLKRIECDLDDRGQNSEVIEAVLLHVEDLHRIDLGYATYSQVKFLVNKFKKLKSVSLHVTSRNLVESVKCLGNCEKLEDLTFSKDGDSKDDHIERNFVAVCRAIAENYPGLKRLELMPIVSLQMCEQLEYLLQKRSTAFSYLNLVFHKYSNNIGNVLGLCTNLEMLELKLYSPDTCFQLSGLNNLKDLCIEFEGIYTNEVVATILASIQDKGPQTRLWFLTSNLYLKKLFIHRLRVFDQSTPMNELNDPSVIQNLLHILITGRHITENITRCIAKCKSLEALTFEHCTLTEAALLELKHCTNLKALLLLNTELPLNCIIRIIRSLPNLIFLYSPKCGASSLDILKFTEERIKNL